jgi:2,4-dichlorophenol 6-monooxygenase
VLTGIAGAPWADAARAVGERLGVPIAAWVLGPGREVQDTYDDWARAREVAESGCVLVRPDGFVAWRCPDLDADPAAALEAALRACLGLGETGADAPPAEPERSGVA